MINIVFDKIQKSDFAKFKDMDGLRIAVNKHVRTIEASELSAAWKRKLIRLLDYLRDISRNYPGLSFRSQRKIAADFGVKKPDTIGVWLKKLASLGIVNILPTKRSSTMQQTVNLVQIMPAEPAENEKRGQAPAENGEHEDNIFSKTSTNINTNTYPAEPLTFYQRFKSFVKNVNSQDETLASRMYGVYRGQTAALLKSDAYDKEDLENIAMSALHAAVMATKSRRIRNLPGFFNGVISRMIDSYIDDIIEQESVPLTAPLPVW
ncbi:helix-turn-helix domain-containing protein [Domibacillus indicus]|uniref:helix-turn-helix domain-containing protein n=1 Tax=Domibacillus indicus TaxID=1437523 RepID=UPI00203BA653|nr:helix-turn-helix domain-containing protein [Domibacillus indicus]MCM3786906.1 helix-turn-helix domain-containing protein [Domibacillus indicus]